MNNADVLLCDQTIVLTSPTSAKYYPEKLRRIKLRDLETGKVIVLLTKTFKLPVTTIAQLYRELFFK